MVVEMVPLKGGIGRWLIVHPPLLAGKIPLLYHLYTTYILPSGGFMQVCHTTYIPLFSSLPNRLGVKNATYDHLLGEPFQQPLNNPTAATW